jgi:hypothetical protein
MPCPYFLPLRRLDHNGWIQPPRLPLGAPYAGSCHADPALPFEPPEMQQREQCNCGYARSRCAQFPAGAKGDAVRFSIAAHSSRRVELIYVLEKDHAPMEHERLVYLSREDRWEAPQVPELVSSQARAFLDSHGKLRSSAAGAP